MVTLLAWRYPGGVRLFDLTPAELSGLVEELYLEHLGAFQTPEGRDRAFQLSAFLRARPLLADEVLGVWLASFEGGGRFEPGDREDAEAWYDLSLLAGHPG